MLSNYGGNIAVEDEEKPTFSDIDDEDYDEEDDVEYWGNWTGGDGEAAGVSTGLRTHAQTCSHTRQSPWIIWNHCLNPTWRRDHDKSEFSDSAFSRWLKNTQRNLLDDHPTNF